MREKDVKMLFEQYYERLVLFAESYVGVLEVAEDIVQDVFLTILSRTELRVEYTKSYLFSCVKNTCVDYLRKLKVSDPLDTKVIDAAYYTGDLDVIEQERVLLKVEEAVKSLPEQRRKILTMYFYQGLSYGQISERTGLSINTIKTHMKMAYQDIRNILKDSDIDNDSLSVMLLIVFRRGKK